MINYVELYAELVRSGKIKIDRVPAKYRDAVREVTNNG